MSEKLKAEFTLDNLKYETNEEQLKILRETYFGENSLSGEQSISCSPLRLKKCCSSSTMCHGCFDDHCLKFTQVHSCVACKKVVTYI